jgi:hypothetical protein
MSGLPWERCQLIYVTILQYVDSVPPLLATGTPGNKTYGCVQWVTLVLWPYHCEGAKSRFGAVLHQVFL